MPDAEPTCTEHCTRYIGTATVTCRILYWYSFATAVQPSRCKSCWNVTGSKLLRHQQRTCSFLSANHLKRFCRLDQQCRFRYHQSRKAAGIRYRFAHTTSVLPRCQHCPVETSKGTGRTSQNPVPDHTAQGRKWSKQCFVSISNDLG